MSIVKILAIVVVTSVVTLLCIRSGQAMAKTPMPSPPAGGPEAHDRGKRPGPVTSDRATNSTAAPNATASGPYTTSASLIADPTSVSFAATTAAQDRQENRTFGLAPETGNLTGDAVPTTLATSRSMDADAVDDGHPSGSRSRALPIVVRGKLIRQIPYPANHQTANDVDDDDDRDDDNSNGANIIVDAGVYHVDNGPYLRQMDHHNQYSSTDTDTSMAQEDGSTGYHNSYDVTYTVGENDGTGWSPVSQPVPMHGTGSPHPGGGNAVHPMGRPPYGSPAPYPYPAGHGMGTGYKQAPMVHAHYGPPLHVGHTSHYQHNGHADQYNVHSPLQQIQMITDKIDWQKVGILALFKVGLAKLKAFGFLKILFLLVFKLKMFLIAMFFKFLLIAKLMKFFKLLMIPLIFIALLPIIASLFSAPMVVGGLLSIPGRIIDYLTGPVYAPVAATAATAYSASGGPTVLPTITSAKIGGGSDLLKPGGGELNVVDRRRLETLELFDPALTVFRKLLDSEKCVERIACRMAVVEKTGILPIWINWVLHQVSKFVPSEKLESYFKAFDEVNNEIYTQTETPDNWATWCTERYDCNITHASSKSMNVTDTKQ